MPTNSSRLKVVAWRNRHPRPRAADQHVVEQQIGVRPGRAGRARGRGLACRRIRRATRARPARRATSCGVGKDENSRRCSRHQSGLYGGHAAPPAASCSASATAPAAGSPSSSCTVLRGRERPAAAATAPACSHGTARKMPPARMNGNACPTRSSRRATDSAADSSSLAAPRRMPTATASPSANAGWTHCASAPIAAGFRLVW